MFPYKSFSKRQKSKVLLTRKARVLVWVCSRHTERSSYSFHLWASAWLGREPSRALSGWHFPLHGQCVGSWTTGDLRIWTALWKTTITQEVITWSMNQMSQMVKKGRAKNASLIHCRNTFSGLGWQSFKFTKQKGFHPNRGSPSPCCPLLPLQIQGTQSTFSGSFVNC